MITPENAREGEVLRVRLEAFEARVAELEALEARVAELEALEARLAELEALEARLAELEAASNAKPDDEPEQLSKTRQWKDADGMVWTFEVRGGKCRANCGVWNGPGVFLEAELLEGLSKITTVEGSRYAAMFRHLKQVAHLEDSP